MFRMFTFRDVLLGVLGVAVVSAMARPSAPQASGRPEPVMAGLALAAASPANAGAQAAASDAASTIRGLFRKLAELNKGQTSPYGRDALVKMLDEALAEAGGALAAAANTVTGSVGYRERIMLPPSAVVKVQLVDVSRADAPATVLGEQTFEIGGKGSPYAFEIAYDPAKIEANHTYAVQARIEVGGQLRFISDQHHAVITRGAPAKVEIVLKGVSPPAPK